MQGVSTVSAYFPEGLWYDIFSYDRVVGGKTQTLQAPLGQVPVHMRAGAIIPLQEPALTSAQVRTSPFTLLVALPQQVSLQESAFSVTEVLVVSGAHFA